MPNGAESVATKRVAYGLASRIGEYHGYEGYTKKTGEKGLRKIPKGAKRQYVKGPGEVGYAMGHYQGITPRGKKTARASMAQARTNTAFLNATAKRGQSVGPYNHPGGREHWVGYKSPSNYAVAKAHRKDKTYKAKKKTA